VLQRHFPGPFVSKEKNCLLALVENHDPVFFVSVSEFDFIEGLSEIGKTPSIAILTNQQVSTLGDFGRSFAKISSLQLQVRHPNKSPRNVRQIM
jgi:hypothetical protein